jgi:thymidylate kinase
MLNNLTQPHEYPGKLFVVEGIDGSGKTTQLGLLAKWLSAEGHRVFVTEWNSSALVKAAYFRVPSDVSVDRLLARRVKLKFYEAGMDLGWSSNPVESFRLFQGKVLDEYDQIVHEFGMEVIDARSSITDQQRLVRQVIAQRVQTSKMETIDDEPV